VLGFIAALVLAPLVENWVIAVLTVFAIIPLTALGAGYAWQLLPQKVASRFGGKTQFALLFVIVACAGWAAVSLADRVEAWMFYGDFKAWLDGRVGTGTPGNAVLAWPLLLVVLVVIDRRYLVDRIARRLRGRSRGAVAAIEAAKYALLVVVSLASAAGIGWLVAVAGFDPRGELFGTYVQRNALIVGFVTGFAVIPIIYTIAEDALSAVPQILRSASLGCGATRWQTATRVVVPVALSGIFSAIMIGLGRAVGETMIVLMAAGNTALMDFNIFNGLRTLSANIAVELPEAVKDGTLYRMLFLAALTLFVLTFIVNTLAEVIRQRVRRRAYQL
jgi:phosphate transport system permease protein